MSTNFIELSNAHPVPAGSLRSVGRDLARFTRFFLTCLEVAQQRRQLVALDARALRDIGLGADDVLREASRGFWDISGVPNAGRG